ncbi:MAG: VWA domain-containing protein [Planctomycetota bacterium]
MTAWKRRLSWMLQLLVLAGLGWLLDDPQRIFPTQKPRPYRIFFEHPSQLEFIQKTLSTFSFPEKATFEFASPSGQIQTAPKIWEEINWTLLSQISWPTEETTREIFKLPFRIHTQDVFLFHRATIPEIQQSAFLAQLFKENQIRFFPFGPKPLSNFSTEEILKSKPQPLFQINAIHTNHGVDVLCEEKGLTDPIHLFWEEQPCCVWTLPEATQEIQRFQYSIQLPPGTHILWAQSGSQFTETSIHVPAPLRVLSLDSQEENGYLETLLKAQGIEVICQKDLPEKLTPYSVLLLGGATAFHLSIESSARIQHFVQKEGGALAFFQGEPDFLTSTWNQWLPLQKIQTFVSPIAKSPQEIPEKSTPPEINNEKDLQEGEVLGKKKIEESSLCLLIILDRSGSMQGEKLELAKQSAIACLKELKEEDLLGIITFNQFPTWILYPTPVSKQSEIIQAVHRIQAEGDTFIYPALVEAKIELRKQKVSAKHIILLSDGYSQRANYRQIVEELVQDQITLSTIGIGTDFDHSLMANLSEWGCGRFYFTTDFTHIARYVTLDTRKVVEEIRDPAEKPKPPDHLRKKPKVVPENQEKTTPPTEKKEAFPVLGKGPLFKTESPPPVLKYRKAVAQEKAYVYAEVQGQPLLAIERCGTGKIMHFIGRFEEDWSPDWLQWKRIAPFWGQAFKHIVLEKKEQPELLWSQESTPEKTRIRISFPVILDTTLQYFLKPSGPAEAILAEFDSPSTLLFEFPYLGTGFYRFSGYSSQQENLFSLKGILVPPLDFGKSSSGENPQRVALSDLFSEVWSYQPLPPLYSETVTRYFSLFLAIFVILLWGGLFLRYRS